MSEDLQPDRPWEQTPKAREEAEHEQRSQKTFTLGCLGVVALIVVLSVLLSLGDDEVDPEVERFDAERVCQDFVSERLKSPSSAEFDTTVTGIGPEYTVTGTVDSQNSFGAMVRKEFSCTVRGDGETWRLQDLSGLND